MANRTGMIDLKRTPAEIKKNEPKAISTMADEYPYGTRITLNEEQIAKMPFLQDVSAGDVVSIEAVGKVTRSESRDVVPSDGGEAKQERTVEIQIQKMEVDADAAEQAAFEEADEEDA